MSMNHYEHAMAHMAKEIAGKGTLTFKLFCEELVRRFAELVVRADADPSVVLNMDRTLSPDASQDEIQTRLRLFLEHYMHEVLATYLGVDVLFKDKALVESLMRADLDLTANEIQMPFPVVEFTFPEGIRIGDSDYQVSGCLVVDEHSPKFIDAIGRLIRTNKMHPYIHDVITRACTDPRQGSIAVFSVLKHMDGSNISGTAWMRFNGDKSIEDMIKLNTLRSEERMVLCRLARLCIAALAYLQTEQGARALQPLKERANRRGIPATMARELGRRDMHIIHDMLTEKYATSEPQGGHHAGLRTHWRAMHFRALRHERFKRNPDGSVRIVLVSPSLVNADDIENARAVRKVG